MSEDQSRGRRRPSREQQGSGSRSPQETLPSSAGGGDSRRRREREPSDEPRPSKVYKKEPISPDRSSTSSRNENSRKEQPSTSAGSRGGGGDSADAGDNASKRERYEIVHTRPSDIQTKMGSGGAPVTLQTNYYRLLTKPTWRIFQYHVDFSPPIELRRVRGGMLSEHRATLGGYLYDGTKLFTSCKLSEEKTVIRAKSKFGDSYTIVIKYVGVISMTEWQSLQILNLILRRAMEGLKLQLVGRNFYDALAKIDLREYRLQLWPGYQTSIRQHEKDILLCAEIAHKVMRTETVYDILKRCTETARDFEEEFRRNVLGLTVLTDYNNKTYRINDVDFSKNPTKTFKCKEKEVSFIDYYYQKYHIRIRDQKQPLLISKAKDRAMRGGSSDIIILIPELCRPTGLTDTMRSNFQLMRAMADHTRMNPDRRIDRLRIFNQRLQQTEASVQVLNDWNMALDRHLVELNGRVLEPQRIVFSEHRKESAGVQADWTRYFRENGLFTTPSRGLERWSVIATNRNSRELRNFVESLIRAAGGMQMRISRPREIMLYDDRNHSYIQAMEDCSRQDPQLILCLVPNNNAERYSSIKKKGCLERAIPTQVITQKSAGNQRGLMSIATKVAIQINCKLGYTPWMIDLPLSGLMTIGYDVAKSTRDRSKAFGALVASMDMKTNATFYSTVAECSSHDVLANSLWPMMTKALRQYRREHENKLPTRILFYRDGVGEGSLRQVYEHEVKDVVEKLDQEYKRCGSEKPPMFAYVVVSKSINTRFFMNRGQNPTPGTIVDDVVTLPERYDFFLVSQSVRQGTVSPTSYNIVYSNIRLTPDQMQLLTYKMTHLYYNWSGTTRVPAVCQYAKKLATLVATSLYQPPQNALEKKLYYL
ncbi:protein piwi [Bactrocera dorsalis]|uniref:Piwi n=3 Tax=Bactrocera dorsalis TaxID=27457 RepID=A0A141RRN5_BACDO|nr:protein piwi [Bactrocera dorsalis]AMJ42819.1 Piwi [Bactrocera dorsalis]